MEIKQVELKLDSPFTFDEFEGIQGIHYLQKKEKKTEVQV